MQTGLQPIREDHLNALVNLPLKTLSLYGLRIDSCTASVVNREGIRWWLGQDNDVAVVCAVGMDCAGVLWCCRVRLCVVVKSSPHLVCLLETRVHVRV